MQRSRELFGRALAVLPGGVSSPVRAFGAVGGTPLFFAKAAGACFTDADGNEYVDFVQSWGPCILGHAHPEVTAAVRAAVGGGLSFGAPHEAEVELAERVVASYPGLERVRFTSSGTEAVMAALRLARGATGRERIVKFNGCYHGHADALLVAAGSGAATWGRPSSAGVPAAVAALTSVLPLDDEPALERLFAQRGGEIAAVIVEPVPANHGLLPQRPAFLRRLRELCTAHGALLVFDEVISGFRVARGGAAGLYGVAPDLATFGKVLGGGMPVGAFAGRAAEFAHLAPSGPVYQAGTLSGNPVAMAAGLATLAALEREVVLERLERLGAHLEQGVRALLARHPGWPVAFVRLGSLFWLCCGSRSAPRRAEDVPPQAATIYRRLHAECLLRGVYLAPSAFEVGFLSAAHTERQLDRTVEVFAAALAAAFAEAPA